VSPDDIGIAGGGVLPPESHLYPVCPTGEECRIHLVQGDIDPLDFRNGVKGLCSLYQQVRVVEVPAMNMLVGDRPELYHCRSGEHQPNGLPDLFGHADPSCPSGRSGKSGADTASPLATRWKLTSGMMKCPALV